jgi:hypothetical protein
LDYKLIIYNLKKTPQDFQFKLNWWGHKVPFNKHIFVIYCST